MNNKRALFVIFSVCFLLLIAFGYSYKKELFLSGNIKLTNKKNNLSEKNEDKALEILESELKNKDFYQGRFSLSCLTFSIDGHGEDYFEITARENHVPECGGDPDVAPRVDSFKVYFGKKNVLVEDAANEKFITLTEAKKVSEVYVDCENLKDKIVLKEMDNFTAVVSSKNRLYFYDAPSKECKMGNLFVVNGDSLEVSNQHGAYSKVKFTNKNTSKVYDVWVETNGIVRIN